MGILEILVILLLIMWATGGFFLHLGGDLIHILLVIALIVIVFRLFTGRKV